ncbi:MAG: type III pantothenate kinase [Candidatus Dormibacteria bacterium]
MSGGTLLLAVDVGNTNMVLGLFDGDRLVSQFRMATPANATSDELAATLSALLALDDRGFGEIRGVVISSVVPGLDLPLARLCSDYLQVPPVSVGPGVRTGFKLLVENPKEVGADRIVNTLAAFHKYGGPAIVIDFGTAITYDAVSAEGDFLGGAIAPGIGTSLEGLFSHAAKLYQVDLVAPRTAIGRNTTTNLQSGIVFGFVAQVEGMVARIRAELGPAQVIATGGQAQLVAGQTGLIDVVDPSLTLDGLRLIYELNEPGPGPG